MRRRVFVGLACSVLFVGAPLATMSAAGAGVRAGQDPLGTKNKATGSVVTLGFVSDGKSDAFDGSADIDGAQAAVKYANNYLDGLGGHKIALDVCETKLTPSGATDCTTDMVQANVPIVISPASGVSGEIYQGIEASGIPFLQYASVHIDVLNGPPSSVFVLTNTLGYALAAPAGVAADQGATKVGILATEEAAPQLQAAAPIFYANAGIEHELITVPLDQADMSPQIQAGISNGADAFTMVGPPQFCTSAIKGLTTVGFEGPVIIIPQCLDESSGSATNGGYKGATVLTATDTDPADKEFQQYLAVMKKYAKGADTSGLAQGGYASIIALVQALPDLTGDVTAQTISAGMAGMPSTPLPLGGGITFQCNGSHVELAKPTCSSEVLQATLTAKAKPKNFEVFDTTDLLKLG